MMATPTDLQAFALGFALSEGLIDTPADCRGIEVFSRSGPQAGGGGVACEVHLEIATRCFARLKERRRALAGRTGCGLCGIDSLQALDLVPERVRARPWAAALPAGVVLRAVAAMPALQVLNAAAGALHAAAWATPEGELTDLLEDVGRHNALDKLIGRLTLQGALRRGRLRRDVQPRQLRAGAQMRPARHPPARHRLRTHLPGRGPGGAGRHRALGPVPPAACRALHGRRRFLSGAGIARPGCRCRIRERGLPEPEDGLRRRAGAPIRLSFRRHIPYDHPIVQFPHAVPVEPAASGWPARSRSPVLRRFRRGRGRTRERRSTMRRRKPAPRPARCRSRGRPTSPRGRADAIRARPRPAGAGGRSRTRHARHGREPLPRLRWLGPARRRALHRMRRHRTGDRRHRRRLTGAPVAGSPGARTGVRRTLRSRVPRRGGGLPRLR